MGDLVRNALRRKLAAAEAAGDADRVKRLRRMISPPVVEVVEISGNTTATTIPLSQAVAWWQRPESEIGEPWP